MKILIFSQWCQPEPAFKAVPFASALRARGHDVRILTGFPNYPGGRLYPGYRVRPWQREEIGGVPILRVPLYPSHDGSSVRRALNYLSFAAASALPCWAGWKPDVVAVYNLPTLGFIARIGRALRGTPYVLDLQDIWPDSIFQAGMGSRWIAGPVDWLCRAAYRGADRIIAQSPGFRDELVRRGVKADRVEVIYNWADEAALGSADGSGAEAALGAEDELALRGRFNVVYAGNLGAVQGLEAVVEAAAITRKRCPRIQWVFVGNGVRREALIEMAGRLAPESTRFLPARPMAGVIPLLRRSEVLLVHLKDSPLFSITIPSKIQAYLALGRPILAGVSGDAGRLVELAGAGFCARPGDPEDLARTAEKLAREPDATLKALGESGKQFYRRELLMEVGVARFEQAFLRVAQGRHRGGATGGSR